MSNRRKAFTLIELLVVIAIIALLLSILTPALNTVKERAKRILCKNRLRQWVIAIVAYNSANDNLMFIPRRHGPEGPFPHYMGMVLDYNDASLEARPGEWDVYRINPYIDAFSKTYEVGIDCGVTDLVACPNASGDFMTEWCIYNCTEGWDFNEPGYSYWVIEGVDPKIDIGTESSPDILRDLTIDTLSPRRLLMTEILSCDGIAFGNSDQYYPYRYNHGRTGWSWGDLGPPFPPPGHIIYDPNPQATGRSQAFGDGHIEWRAISLKEGENMPTSTTQGKLEDRWNGPGSGWIQTLNTSYY